MRNEHQYGRCQWCNGSHEGGPVVTTSRGYWWHTDCAQDNYNELEEALS